MSELALSVRSLGKLYSRSAGMGLDLFRRRNLKDTFWALRDVTFDVKRGTGLGIIGGNGAGKSTLLKILSRIVQPTAGEAEINGRANSLLEVGTGFQPDLSGRANIYLNASILGMSRAETDQVFDEILTFSGVGKFIDMPVKHYSSGMYSRLAFSVAANVTGDILLIDEVLSVGDAEFRQKCMRRMNSLLTSEQRTVLFVSHSMNAIMRFCSHALWLDHGCVKAHGTAETVVSEYLRSVNKLGAKYVAPRKIEALPSLGEKSKTSDISVETQRTDEVRNKTKSKQHQIKVVSTEATAGFKPAATIHAVVVIDGTGYENDIVAREDTVGICLHCEILADTHTIHPVVHVYCLPRAGVMEETHVFTCIGEPALPRVTGRYRIEAIIPDHLLTVGQYTVSVALVTRSKPLIRHCKLERVVTFQVIEKVRYERTFLTEQMRGVIQPPLSWHVRSIFHEEVFDDEA